MNDCVSGNKKNQFHAHTVIILLHIGRMACVDNLAPDISLAALKMNKVDPRDLQGLELIGEGSFAQVFRVRFLLVLLLVVICALR